MEPLFKIEQLTCSYTEGKPVLKVGPLTIQRGQLIFVVGVSGSGKSTFVETLGLMNDTIGRDSKVQFIPQNGNPVPLESLWGQAPQVLDRFRQNYFSFIFQQTNLMPNFTCGENMMLTALLKGKSYTDAKEVALKYMGLLGLPADIFDKRVVEVSGGQRQRIAFIRAICSDFSVLFGDEPTGNLDPKTAVELMAILKDLLQEQHRTGIVVSHDIELALRFADVIIPIGFEMNGTERIGSIQADQILHRDPQNQWALKGVSMPAPKEHLLAIFSQKNNVQAA